MRNKPYWKVCKIPHILNVFINTHHSSPSGTFLTLDVMRNLKMLSVLLSVVDELFVGFFKNMGVSF